MKTVLRAESMRRSLSREPASEKQFGAAQEDATGRAYNQAAFHYFLALEQKRSELAGRVFVLLLVDKHVAGAPVGFDPDTAARLFVALRGCLRDTDLLGWYQEGLVMGAVLTHLAACSATPLVEDRFGRTIRESLERESGARIHVRVFQPSTATYTAGQSWP